MTIECSRCGGNHMRSECPTLGISVEDAFCRAFDRADKLEQALQEAQDQIQGMQRSIWLILRATSIGRPLHIPRTYVEDFNPHKANLESWTEPNGDYCFRAALS